VATALLAVGLVMSITAPGDAADVVLQAGLIVLMGTPMARVVLTFAEYARERDWFFAGNALGVIVVLATTIWQAWRR
jgi:uncharacterized membrane protein